LSVATPWIWLGFSIVALIVYGPVLSGGFISDDIHYVAANEYVHTPSADNWIAIWNPRSEVTELVENYAPVHLSLHALDWQLFGPDVLGHHVVNVLLHALAAALLVPIFRRSGIGDRAALLGAASFLLHPTNVEAVAWISQLKSSAALVLSLAALLLHPRRPLLALLFFALALLAKPFAAFALIVASLFQWMRGGGDRAGAGGQRAWAWLAAWLVVLLGFAWIETLAFSLTAGLAPPLYADPWIRILTAFSLALRYLLMAATGLGLSTFHEPPAVTSVLDPWLIGGLCAIAFLGWRVVVCLRQRREEAIYWLWAAIGFGPLSGIVSLPYPMADRYLYFVLPGLIGALLLWAQEILPAVSRRFEKVEYASALRIALILGLTLLLAHFAYASYSRTSIFRTPEGLMADAERNYPEGAAANTRKASRAARQGDYSAAMVHLRAAHVRGYNRVDYLLQDSAYAAMQDHPEFMALKLEMARDWISRLGKISELSHYKARALAQAYVVTDELDLAVAALERAAEAGGPIAETLRADALAIQRKIDLRKRLEARRGSRAGAEP
jgi:hypothetical protein